MRNTRNLPSPAKLFRATLALTVVFSGAALLRTQAVAQTTPNFGPNVVIFDPSMSGASISSTLSAAAGEAQFSTNRHAFLFKPGTYNGVSSEVGFYESIAGLGTTPDAVTLNGGGVYSDQVDASGNITTNFWRSVENMRVNPPLDSNGTTRTNRWGVSQGAAFRRMHIGGGDLELTNSRCGFASGGFISDAVVDGKIESCSQQQWYTRNSSMASWTGNVWNMVFSGDIGAPAQHFPNPSYTNLSNTPVSREKPFLYIDSSGNYNVFVPTLRTNSVGTTWSGGGLGVGFSMPISSFYIAQPSNTAAQINSALASGKSLILTPGIYQLSAPINVTNANTIVLGLGYATLVPQNGTAAITVADVDGVQLAGLLIDAGPTNSAVLVQVGNTASRVSHANNPTSLNDVFFRIGGATLGKATTSLEVDSDNVILDNIWAWRADHGNAGTTGWTVNTAATGVLITGDNVTALGLAVEHYQQNQVQWNGNGGETIFYQSELPYDVPNQAAWSSGTTNGYPSYVVGSNVCSHQAYGLGVYSYFIDAPVVEDSAIRVPNVTGVDVTDAVTVFLNGTNSMGSITHVVNDQGASVQKGANPSYLNSYIGSGTCTGGGGGGTGAVLIDSGSTTAVGGYSADQEFVGGGTYSTTHAITVAAGDSASQAVYQTARQGTFTYTITGLTPGSTHTVKLHFAELYFPAAGDRKFNVLINNASFLTDFDIFQIAGGKDIATVQTTTATAIGGQIVIAFKNGTVNQPMVEGIEVQ